MCKGNPLPLFAGPQSTQPSPPLQTQPPTPLPRSLDGLNPCLTLLLDPGEAFHGPVTPDT